MPASRSRLALILAMAALVRGGEPGQAEPSQPTSIDGFGNPALWEDAVHRMNDDIFWSPASASNDVITRFGDEARAVFGPIPEGNCAEGVAMPLEVEGNLVDLMPNTNKAGQPLEFAHHNVDGKIVKWTKQIPKCDKPSLTGTATYCGLNSRLTRVMRGHVEWLFLCRKSSASGEVGNNAYWLASNPKFRLFGTIGFNHQTGEIVFFDGRKDRDEFDWSKPFVPPGGKSYSDRTGRAAAEDLYDPTFAIQCSACHDNKSPYVITPHALQSRVGYVGGAEDPRAIAFSLGDYLPEIPRVEGAPFRVIGSGYTKTYSAELMRARTVRDPTGNCTSCHTLTTQITGQRFAADAVARKPWISNPTRAQLMQLKIEEVILAKIANRRTLWALRSGPGKIHPWMLPGHGNDLAGKSEGLSEPAWRALSDCLWGGGGSECGYHPLYTSCLPPEPAPSGDGSKPLDLMLSVLPLPAGEKQHDRMVQVTWRYLNSYGSVPTRDDVRFDLAVKGMPTPSDRRPPEPSDYPATEEVAVPPLASGGVRPGSIGVVRNASYLNHVRWTDPTPTTESRRYQVNLPATCGRRYLVRVVPKRFCFDQSDVAYSSQSYLRYADVTCD